MPKQQAIDIKWHINNTRHTCMPHNRCRKLYEEEDNRAIHEVFSRVIQCIWFLTHLLLILSIAFEIHNFADGKGEVRTCQFQMTWQPSAKNSIYLLRKTSFKRHYYLRAVVFLEWTIIKGLLIFRHLQRNVLVWHFTSGWLDLYKSWKKGHTSSYQKELFLFSIPSALLLRTQ